MGGLVLPEHPGNLGKGIRWGVEWRVCNMTQKTSLTLKSQGEQGDSTRQVFDEGRGQEGRKGREEVRNEGGKSTQILVS